MKVLVCGDAMIDRYWFGEVARISPEAPVPVLAVEREEERAGGAANVARNLEAMGVEVATLYSASHAADPVVKLRLIARGQQLGRVDFDRPQAPLAPEEVIAAARDCAIVVFSDYAKGTLDRIAALVWRLKREGRRVLIDPKRRDFRDYAGADVLKPNLAELRSFVGAWRDEDDLEQRVKAMQRRADIPVVLATRGAAGMTLYAGAVAQIPADAREVYDVTGAGDTALAAFTAALVRGADHVEAARAANRAAGIAVGRFGTAVVTAEELFG